MDVAIFATLKKLLGTKTDTGGSTTEGTVNGKLNTVITNTTASTSANASGTLSQKLTYIISTLIGATGATGGTATAGTIMSKLNALLTSWTSARAGYVDTINTNTATNNTASSTGLLSQKLSYLISQRTASLTGVGATVFSAVPFPASFSWTDNTKPAILAKFIAPVSGMYTFTFNLSSQRHIVKFGRGKNVNFASSGNSYANDIDPFYAYNNVSVGAVAISAPIVIRTAASFSASLSTAFQNSLYDDLKYALGAGYSILGIYPSGGASCNFYCEAGEPVILAAVGTGGTSPFAVTSAVVTYQPI